MVECCFVVFVCFNNQSIGEIHREYNACFCPFSILLVVFFLLLFDLFCFLLDESGCFFDRCSLERLLVDLFPLHIYRYFYSVIIIRRLGLFYETVRIYALVQHWILPIYPFSNEFVYDITNEHAIKWSFFLHFLFVLASCYSLVLFSCALENLDKLWSKVRVST